MSFIVLIMFLSMSQSMPVPFSQSIFLLQTNLLNNKTNICKCFFATKMSVFLMHHYLHFWHMHDDITYFNESSIFNIYKIPQHKLLTMIIATLDIYWISLEWNVLTRSSQSIGGKTHKHFIICRD